VAQPSWSVHVLVTGSITISERDDYDHFKRLMSHEYVTSLAITQFIVIFRRHIVTV